MPAIQQRSLATIGGFSELLALGRGELQEPEIASEVIAREQRSLVAKSRFFARKNDYARGFLMRLRDNVVGSNGIVLQSRAGMLRGEGEDVDAQTSIEAAFKTWGKRNTADVSGTLSWLGIQQACVRSLAVNGEFMLRIVYGKNAGPWGFALRVLDPQRCDPTLMRDDGGNVILNGVEIDAFGRPVAYHFADSRGAAINGRTYQRIPADEIIHGFRTESENQYRGLPWLESAIGKMRELDGFTEAALINARVGAAKMGFIEWAEGSTQEDGPDVHEIEAEPGTFQFLPEGATLREWKPEFPIDIWGFIKSILRAMSTGLGIGYNTLSGDLEGVSFSSIRQSAIEERERWKTDQQLLIETLCEPVFDAWLRYSVVADRIAGLKLSRLGEYLKREFQARRWAWIDPSAEVTASIAAKNNMLTSPGRLLREQGLDPANVWKELGKDLEAMRSAGIPQDVILSSMLGQNYKAAKDDNGKTDQV
jgi:lambda family phage portal protein